MLVQKQKPAFRTAAAGQQLIVVVTEDTNIIGTEQMVKFNAGLHIAHDAVFMDSVHYSTYSATPNSAGVAIFDFGRIVENYVKPQYNGVKSTIPVAASEFQGVTYSEDAYYHSIHNIDKYCYAPEVVKFWFVSLTMEWLGAMGNPDVVEEFPFYLAMPSSLTYNGVLYNTDKLSYKALGDPDFGYDLAENGYILDGKARGGFLTDMPQTFEARVEDYGTVAFFNCLSTSGVVDFSFETQGAPTQGVDYMMIKCWTGLDGTGSQIGADIQMPNRQTNGGWSGISPDEPSTSFQVRQGQVRYLFAGVYPANLRGWSSIFQLAVAGGTLASYTIQPVNESYMGVMYTCNIISDCLYEPIRLAWLNKHGAWDYYTFIKKSVRTLTSKHTQYQKLDGTWNEATYNLNKNQGGRKNYKTHTKEKIRINTDYITEETAAWLAQLQTANEVLIVKDYITGGGLDVIRAFTEPCTLTSTSFTKKTRANDKLIQYTFEIEKANDIKSQGA
jgi:hypothetical protein